MVRLVVQEALMLGWRAARCWRSPPALPLVWRLARVGPRLQRLYRGSSYAFQGVLFDPVIYGDFGAWIVAVRLRRRDRARRCSPRSTRRGTRRAPIRPSR